jgi:hypothetical protein
LRNLSAGLIEKAEALGMKKRNQFPTDDEAGSMSRDAAPVKVARAAAGQNPLDKGKTECYTS